MDCSGYSGWLADEVTECVTNRVVAEDAYKPVETSTSISSSGTCKPSIVVTATVQDWGERFGEDVSSVADVKIKVYSNELETSGEDMVLVSREPQHFYALSSYPSEGPRASLDETVNALPFDDGPGVFLSLSQDRGILGRNWRPH
jgi:hypothetical protein